MSVLKSAPAPVSMPALFGARLRALVGAALALSFLFSAGIAQAGGHVTLDARLHRGALLLGGDGLNHLRVRLDVERIKMTKRLPLNVALVIDRSGSMAGDKIVNVREAAKFVIDQLQDGDIVSVVSFDNGAEVLQAAASIDSLDRAAVKRKIDKLRDRGGTDMVSGLTTGLDQARRFADSNHVNRVILLSDGRPNTADGLTALAASGLPKGIFLTTMGVGNDYNEDLMSKLADAGSGNYYFIEKADAIASIFKAELKDLMAVVAREGVLSISLAEGVVAEQVFGYDAKVKPGKVTIPMGDLFGGVSAEVLIRVKVPVANITTNEPVADVKFSYHDAIDQQGAKLEAHVAIEVTKDTAKIAKSVAREVGSKVIKVQAALAKQEAMKLYEQGKRAEAQQVLRSGAAAVSAATDQAEEAVTQEMAKDLEALGGSLSAPSAAPAGKAIRKKAKAAARKAMRR